MTLQGTISLSRRAFSDEDLGKLRTVCDDIAPGVFCSIVVKDALESEELTAKYMKKAQQFEDDQAPASIAEMKTLRAQLRQQEEELEALRKFKESMQPQPAHSFR